jgi:LysM repeat protein
MATYTIKSGDTLSAIAKANNTDVASLMAANKGNAAVKSANLISTGGTITLPAAVAAPVVTPPITTDAPGAGAATPVVTSPATTGSSAVPSNAMPSTDISASFGPAIQDINDVEDSLDSMFPAPPDDPNDPANPGYETYQANKGTIAAQSKQAQDQITQQQNQGTIQQNKALDLLRLSPAGIKENIDSFIESSNDFEKGIADDLTTLDAEEQSALANNDDTYLAGIRQAKLDYFNMKSQAATTKFNTLASAYNLMLTGQTNQIQEAGFEQQQASNLLNTLLPAYAGTQFSALPADVQSQLTSAAGTLGIPPDTMQALISNKSVAFHVSKGDYTYFFDSKGNVVSQVYTPAATSGGSPSTEIQSFLNGDITKFSSANSGAGQDALNQIQSDYVGGQIWNSRSLITNAIKQSGTKGLTGGNITYGNTTAPATPTGYAQIRSAVVSQVMASFKANPQNAAAYLGLDYSPSTLTSDQTSQLQSYVANTVSTLIPDSYFSNVIGSASGVFQTADSADTSVTDQNALDDAANNSGQ